MPASRNAALVLVALTATLGLAVRLAAAQRNAASEVVSKAEFVVADGECGLNFTITYRNETITGSIAWTEEGLVLHVPPEAFVVAGSKLAENAIDIYGAIVSRKLGIGFYDGTILPITLVDLDPKPFSACMAQKLSQWEKPHWR
jgi:hypothetical protein